MSVDQEYDKLVELLTVERVMEEAITPSYGGFCGSHPHYRYFAYSWSAPRTQGKFDIAYRNKEGNYHRIYGPAYISGVYDLEIWYKDGKFHREGGPAIRHGSNLVYYREGLLHRLDGPAVVDLAGPKQYWINGCKYSPKEYKKEIQRMQRRGLIK